MFVFAELSDRFDSWFFCLQLLYFVVPPKNGQIFLSGLFFTTNVQWRCRSTPILKQMWQVVVWWNCKMSILLSGIGFKLSLRKSFVWSLGPMFILRFQIHNRSREKLDLLEIGEAMCQTCTMLKARKSCYFWKEKTKIDQFFLCIKLDQTRCCSKLKRPCTWVQLRRIIFWTWMSITALCTTCVNVYLQCSRKYIPRSTCNTLIDPGLKGQQCLQMMT